VFKLRCALLALAAASLFAAPASASTIVITSQFGSGSIAGAAGCALADVPTGAGGTCSGLNLANQTLVLTAIPQASPSGHWKFLGWSGCPSVSGTGGVQCTITDNSGPTPTGQLNVAAFFQDTVGPTLSNVAFAASTATDRTAQFSWSTNEPLSSARCSIDNGPETVCTGANAHTATVDEGQHTFKVRGLDRSGNLGGFTTNINFRTIETSLVSTPAAISNDKNPTFVYSSKSGLSFECRLDAAAFSACGNAVADQARLQLTNLADGKHTFRVQAKDLNLTDAVPASFSWVVDTVAPTATLSRDSGPGEGALQATTREPFAFAADEESTFQCRLDAADFAPCTSGIVVENLAPGAHRFEVRAVDAAGNIGAVVARNWVVAAPVVTPPPVVVQQAKTEQVIVTLGFFASKVTKKTTKFTTLQVKNVPLGATVNAVCSGKGCPSGLKGKGFTKTNAFGTVTLAKFIKKAFKAGDRITVTVSKENAINAVKILTVRASKKPLIATKCVPPGAKQAVAC
jgi:hypothetical protein